MTSRENSFWKRNGLQEADRLRCIHVVRGMYGGYRVEEIKDQGYCSFTLLLTRKPDDGRMQDRLGCRMHFAAATNVGVERIVQLRPVRYALDLALALDASMTYPSLVPAVRGIDVSLPGHLRAYEMNKMEGTPLSRVQPQSSNARDFSLEKKQETLITRFAEMIGQSWPKPPRDGKRRDSVLRAESSDHEGDAFLSLCTGKVGSRIVRKLEQLSRELPDLWLRTRAAATLEKLLMIHEFPVVLNHGDLIPSNILVDEDTWEITGLVDWAEAETLPFGTCLYGLEHCLGFLQPPSQGLGHGCTFVFYDNAVHLRERFWRTLSEALPQVGDKKEEVGVMRDVGVFLWHGFAWDGGAIDRVVVDDANDSEELAKLRAFLSI